jgi:hypothetical protein
MSEQLSYENFEKLVNTKFEVKDFDEKIELELFEIADRKITAQQEIFSLLFRGPNDKVLSQGIFNLGNEDFSDTEIFLVPIGQNEEGITYQAVFNLLVKS